MTKPLDEPRAMYLILNADLWTICKPYTSNPPVAEQAMIDELISYIQTTIASLAKETEQPND